jgi:superfamily II DNA or RNA helicase
MSDLFSSFLEGANKPTKKVFANPNTIYNTVIFLLNRKEVLPCLEVALHPAQNTKDGLTKLGKKLEKNMQTTEQELYEQYGGGLAPLLLAFTRSGFEQWARKRSITIGGAAGMLPFGQLADSNQQLFLKYYHSLWKSYWPHLSRNNNFFAGIIAGAALPPPEDIAPLQFSPNPLKATVKITAKGKGFTVEATVTAKNEIIAIEHTQVWQHLLYLQDGVLYLPENPLLFHLLGNVFEKGSLQIDPSLAQLFLTQLLPDLQDNFTVELDSSLQPKRQQVPLQPYLLLSEMEPDLLVLKPIFKYGDAEPVEYDEKAEVVEHNANNRTHHLERDKAAEVDFKNQLQQLHPLFAKQNQQHFFYLPIKEAVKNHWFGELTTQLQQQGIVLYGQTSLKKLKYNTNKPMLQIGSSSGTDWFDLKVLLQYGEQTVSLAQLRQAVLNKQDYVQLGDGTWGLLPQEWLQRFTNFFKLGKTQGEEIQVSKKHFSAIGNWPQIDTSTIAAELEQKKQQLLQLDKQESFDLPRHLNATLRPYQMAGYQWLRQLHSIGWGGCLADDMGLGKTLQTLSFLQSVIEDNPKAQLLIVCPTSLMYNWIAEIEKFTPQMQYLLYHGANRALPKQAVQLIITSYGTLRSDIEQLQSTRFEVVVLDESQVIKNPASQAAKAVNLLQANSRFVLSGTPIQNNTMDIYPQLNFTNPGLLGSAETFKELFVNPIDKKGDAFAVEQLKQMVRPFLLRRTKEQVAKDLPDKTETILYCEMDTYQRQVYDAVKEEYKEKIVSGATADGMPAVLMLLLEGLGKLRMICDCPSLVKADDGKRFKQQSVKADELMREITENSSDHKILVFSQFLGMLQIVRERLAASGINTLYLDGSTKPADRGQLVKQFQEDATQQVFLISLKAGGVGLNLTAADYVYLLDPWWNPAAEDQAIDRSHRIGQTRKVFAYKMICRNTVEEKIIQLQQKKKHLAKELISEETSFVKKLTLDDVQFLLG